MPNESNDARTKENLHPPKKSLLNKMMKVGLGFVLILCLIGFIVTNLTPVPYVFVFRQIIGALDTQVNLGPYADQVSDVIESEIIDIPVEGIPDAGLTIYRPAEESTELRPIILFIHGGGWVVGTAESVSPFAKLLASEGYVVANLDYSLAPEYQYPSPIIQSIAAIDYLMVHGSDFGGDVTRLFIGGNSAGAQIASQLGAMITNPTFESEIGIFSQMPTENLRGIILYSGPYNFATMDDTNFPGWIMYPWSYTGQRNYEEYARIDELSTVQNVTPDYPPTYMTVGDADPLEPQTYELDAILRDLNVDVTSRYWTGSGRNLPHDYHYELNGEAAQIALEDVLQFLSDNSQP